jgi:hypothetical protein
VRLVKLSKGFPRSVHEQVGEPRAFRRVRRATEAAAFVNDESVGSDRAVAMKGSGSQKVQETDVFFSK